MNAEFLLTSIVAALADARLEAILIGNAAAALQSAPVTTLDFDFMFRATPPNLNKLKRFARNLDAVILRPYYPVSALYRVVDDARGLQADFMPRIHGVKSFNSLRSRAERFEFGGRRLWVASLGDILASKRAVKADRETRPSLTSLKQRCMRKVKRSRRRQTGKRREAALAALARESERSLIELIQRRLALPIEKRMNFLRVRRPGGGSHL